MNAFVNTTYLLYIIKIIYDYNENNLTKNCTCDVSILMEKNKLLSQ